MLIHGDTIEVMSTLLGDESVDMILTSPPYDQTRVYPGVGTLDLGVLGEHLYRVLKPDSVCVVVMQDQTKDYAKSLTTFRACVDWCDRVGFRLFECGVYAKDARPGAWWNTRFRVEHEYILMLLKGSKPHYFAKDHMDKVVKAYSNKGTTRMTSGELARNTSGETKCTKSQGTIFQYTPSKSERAEDSDVKRIHPATFPDAMAGDFIRCFAAEGDIVLDPLCGSGTSCIAAYRSNRDFIGIDAVGDYLEAATTRLLMAGYENPSILTM